MDMTSKLRTRCDGTLAQGGLSRATAIRAGRSGAYQDPPVNRWRAISEEPSKRWDAAAWGSQPRRPVGRLRRDRSVWRPVSLSATGDGMAALKIKSSWEGILRPSYFFLTLFLGLTFLCFAQPVTAIFVVCLTSAPF